jgi:hypothetical protein
VLEIPGLSRQRWPVHPHRLNDELLSCWITRTAYGNGLKLQSFTTLALGKGAALWNRDIDGSASESVLDRLSSQTGSSVDELRGGMLSGYDTKVFGRHNPNGNTKWVLPLGIYHRTRKLFGLQFCPLCLFSDPVPYYRRRWRLALSTLCDVHGTLLHDRCPKCQAPVVYFRNDLGHRSGYRIGDLVSCSQCDFDLRRAPAFCPPGPDGKSIMALRSIATFHDIGWWFQGDFAIHYGPLYFDALHHLVSIFLPSTKGRRMAEVVARETGWSPVISSKQGRRRFEMREIGERHSLLTTALWLLDDWPERFVRVAKEAGVHQSGIIRSVALPFWFECAFRGT